MDLKSLREHLKTPRPTPEPEPETKADKFTMVVDGKEIRFMTVDDTRPEEVFDPTVVDVGGPMAIHFTGSVPGAASAFRRWVESMEATAKSVRAFRKPIVYVSRSAAKAHRAMTVKHEGEAVMRVTSAHIGGFSIGGTIRKHRSPPCPGCVKPIWAGRFGAEIRAIDDMASELGRVRVAMLPTTRAANAAGFNGFIAKRNGSSHREQRIRRGHNR